jgi:hypothetical protein
MQEASSYSTTFIEPQNLCRKQLTVRLNLSVLTIQSAMNISIIESRRHFRLPAIPIIKMEIEMLRQIY